MFVLNTQRSYKCPVKVVIFDEDGKEKVGNFTATFKIVPQKDLEGERPLNHVLLGVEGIQVPGPDGQPLEGEALLDALRGDPAVSVALMSAYNDSILKKNLPRN